MSFILLGILNSQAAAAGGAGAYDLLETTVLNSTASSVSFSSLGSYSNYKHLQIRAVTKDDFGTENLNRFDVRFNSDTGSNYTYHYLKGNGSSTESSAGTSQTRLQFFDVTAGGSDTNVYGAIILDILDFSNSNKNKTARSLGGGSAGTERNISIGSGVWMSTAAITTITITCGSNFASGSRFSLYGIK